MPPRNYFEGFTDGTFLALLGELQNVSDRVTAISAAAFLDDTLGAALLARFVRIGVTWKDRIFSAPNAPLGSFYSKTALGYALGLFGPSTYGDLDIIRKVRNEFAHTATPLQFNDATVAALCGRLTSAGRFQMGLGTLLLSETGPKVDYVRSVYGIAVTLLGQMRSAPPQPTFPTVLP
jgi:DNA-binding MltR family transcriptional regulator